MTYAPDTWTLPEPRQLDLDEIIAALDGLKDRDRPVTIGFGNPHSYRGDYSELAFEPVENTTIGAMLDAALNAYGETFEGWKGGDYTMGGHVHCWLAFRGDPGEPIGRILLSLLVGEWLFEAPTE